MRNIIKKSNKFRALVFGLMAVIFIQALVIGKLLTSASEKSYEVNLVKINTEKDSVNILQVQKDFSKIDQRIQRIDQYLKQRTGSASTVAKIDMNKLSNQVYLAKASNRYSQQLVDLEKRLQEVPLGHPTSGYISSFFGRRVNPIPPRVLMAGVGKTTAPIKKDSLQQIVNLSIAPQKNTENGIGGNFSTGSVYQYHKGIDFAVDKGTPVHSTAKGKVVFAGVKGGYGNCVIISHEKGLATLYAHLSKIEVKPGANVRAGQVIALSGNTGRSTGPHLHYEVHKNNTPVNPKLFLNL